MTLIFKKIIVASDHAAFEMKGKILEYLKSFKEVTVFDNGVYDTKSSDYPDIAMAACKKIRSGEYGSFFSPPLFIVIIIRI